MVEYVISELSSVSMKIAWRIKSDAIDERGKNSLLEEPQMHLREEMGIKN